MRAVLMDYYLETLLAEVGSPKPAIDEAELRSRFEAKNYNKVVAFIKDSLDFDYPMRIGWWNEDKKVHRHGPLAVYGESGIEIPEAPRPFAPETKFSLFLYKSLMEKLSFEAVVRMVGYCVARAVLISRQSTVAEDMVAAEILVMMMGYATIYLRKETHAPQIEKEDRKLLLAASPGILTLDEAEYVASKLALPPPLT